MLELPGRAALLLFGALATLVCASAEAGNSAEESRRALVIGNAAYADAPLKNPVNDARAMSATLARLGFDVSTVLDADRDALERAIVQFAASLESDSTGRFYYAGHGLHVRGHNDLVPVDARFSRESEVRIGAVDVDLLLSEFEWAGNRINVVVLDADRDTARARDGLAHVVARYVELAERAVSLADLPRAASYVARAAAVDPDAQSVITAGQSIERAQERVAREAVALREAAEHERLALEAEEAERRKNAVDFAMLPGAAPVASESDPLVRPSSPPAVVEPELPDRVRVAIIAAHHNRHPSDRRINKVHRQLSPVIINTFGRPELDVAFNPADPFADADRIARRLDALCSGGFGAQQLSGEAAYSELRALDYDVGVALYVRAGSFSGPDEVTRFVVDPYSRRIHEATGELDDLDRVFATALRSHLDSEGLKNLAAAS